MRMGYLGVERESVHLPYKVRILPTGDVYALLEGGLRRLDSIWLKCAGLAIAGLEGEQILFTPRGELLVGDEIRSVNVYRWHP